MSALDPDPDQFVDVEEMSRQILNAIPGGAVIAFDRDLRIIFAEGHELSKRIGRLLSDVLDPEVWTSFKEANAQILAGMNATFEVVRELRTCSVTLSPLLGKDQVIGGVAVLRIVSEGGTSGSAQGSVQYDKAVLRRKKQELQDRLLWTERVHAWVAKERLVLHGQPIVDLSTGEIQQAELLLRIRDEREPDVLIPPLDFLPAAERLGLVSKIDRWVVGEALEMAEEHRVEINVSGAAISDPEQVHEIAEMISASGAPRDNIIFEISENSVGENMGSARAFAERIRGLGCAIALDKFGVGYGTFTYLKYLPIDYLKIDVEFVRDLTKLESNRNVVKAIVGAAELFDMRTIAEGVEDKDTLEALVGMGVDCAQGFWIGPPVPTDHLWDDESPGKLASPI